MLLILTNIIYINCITAKTFHKLQVLEVYNLDNCVLDQYWKFDNVRLKPNGDIGYEILLIRLFSHFEE